MSGKGGTRLRTQQLKAWSATFAGGKGEVLQKPTVIASNALSLDAVLVTNNAREFKRMPDWVVENRQGLIPRGVINFPFHL